MHLKYPNQATIARLFYFHSDCLLVVVLVTTCHSTTEQVLTSFSNLVGSIANRNSWSKSSKVYLSVAFPVRLGLQSARFFCFSTFFLAPFVPQNHIITNNCYFLDLSSNHYLTSNHRLTKSLT